MKENMTGKTAAAVFIRGIGMGIADLIPGVSGGTIAFISGIYPRLLAALATFSTPALWRALLRFRLRECWQLVDGSFLAVLFAGILTAVLLFAGLLHHWLETAPHLLLAFFFGLVLASIVAVYRRLSALTLMHGVCYVISALVTLYLVSVNALTLSDTNLLTLAAGGMVAICAMILPGISGSYILLVLGLYPAVINAIHERDIVTLLVFALGCGLGLLLFSRLLFLLLQRHYTITMSLLLGVMVGATPKLWPWKANAAGEKIILQPNVLPANFHTDADIGWALLLALAGAAAVLLIDYIARQRDTR